MAKKRSKSTRTLLIVGGYGLVGTRAARQIRAAHPDINIVLGGRNPKVGEPLAAELDAKTVRIDVTNSDPFGELTSNVSTVLGIVTDPKDRLLKTCMARGLPFADVNRAGLPALSDVMLQVNRNRPTAPVLMSGSFYAGLTALVAGRLHANIDSCQTIDITLLSSSDDQVGPNSWGFAERLPWPYYPSRDGSRRVAHPLTDTRSMRCADGNFRPGSLISTLEQVTLPVLLDVPTVESRIALYDETSLAALRALKRAGVLRLLARPQMKKAKEAIFRREGTGDFAGLSVAVSNQHQTARADLLTANGQSELSAVGSACAAQLLLTDQLPSGLSFPEQFVDICDPLIAARSAGVTVSTEGIATPDLAQTKTPGQNTRKELTTL